MRKLVFGGFTAALLAVAMGGTAHADFNIATGLKWVPLKYTTSVGAVGMTDMAQAVTLSPEGGVANGWQNTSLDPYIAFFFTEQVGLSIGLDLGYGSFHGDNTSSAGVVAINPCVAGAMANGCNISYFQFGFSLGGKFYLNRPTAQRVSPYLYVDFYKYFASISNSSDNVNGDAVGAIAGLHAPLGFDIAFGAEYFFTTSFSLGAEVLGLRYSYVEGDYSVGNSTTTEKYQDLTFYTGITLNYRFLATASVHTYEDEEDRANPRPVRRRPVRRAPPPEDNGENAPSPESVD